MTINETARTSVFRHDINGLRAWAVIAVVLYHFGVPGFGGGFVGVDVFFVISGFLMTGIVIGGLELSKFSLLKFYMARARRILPALVVLCAVLLLLGWWMLMPVDYKALGNHAMFSLAFLSNIKFWLEAGYFDTASHEKWLLHTWSLAVEWQFYLLLPLVLLAVWTWRPGRKSVIVAMVVGLVVSLLLCVISTPLKPIAAFYLLPTRAWEMLAGGLVYLLPQRWSLPTRLRPLLELAGLALIVLAIAVFDTSSPWPGWRALVPTAGAVAVLFAARSRSFWTGHPAMQWLGTRSYSLYLWHWPIVVAMTYLEWKADLRTVAAGLMLTLVFGDLSYRLVETSARLQVSRLRSSRGAAVLLGGALAVAAYGAGVQLMAGVIGRFSALVEQAASESNNKNPRYDECFAKGGAESPSCIYGGSRLAAILIGDSHANAVVTALAAAVPSAQDGVMDWTYVSCPTLIGVKNLSPKFGSNEKCGEFLNWALQKLTKVAGNIPLVVVNRTTVYAVGHNEPWEQDAGKPMVYFNEPYPAVSPKFLAEFSWHLTDTACQLAKDRPVYLVRPIPEMGIDVPKAMARALALGQRKDISIALSDYHQRHAVVWAAQDAARDRCGVKILDPLPYLCSDGRCHASKNNRPLYYDDDHLSEYGNKLLVPMFATVFGEAY